VTRAFDDLTPAGQSRRLRALAYKALYAYDLDARRVSFTARAFNSVFRVDGADGASYALRIGPALRIHADGCEALEAAWIDALRRDIGFPSPAVIRTRDASADAWVRVDGVPEPRSCVLFEWVSGRPLRQQMSADLVRRVGELTAVVHEHGAASASADASVLSSNAPVGAPSGALVADRVLSFLAPKRLEELRPAYGSVLEEAVDRAQRTLDALWKHPARGPHLLHGDVQPSNVMVSRGNVTLIDFQDLIWGFEIQDLVFALLAFDQFEDAQAYRNAFRSGYEARRSWPEADPETIAALGAARHLNILNFGLSMRKPGLDTFVARHADRVARWMTNG
jgi:Ser/Thr protein kinase RdoA (MazF antagonist)